MVRISAIVEVIGHGRYDADLDLPARLIGQIAQIGRATETRPDGGRVVREAWVFRGLSDVPPTPDNPQDARRDARRGWRRGPDGEPYGSSTEAVRALLAWVGLSESAVVEPRLTEGVPG